MSTYLYGNDHKQAIARNNALIREINSLLAHGEETLERNNLAITGERTKENK